MRAAISRTTNSHAHHLNAKALKRLKNTDMYARNAVAVVAKSINKAKNKSINFQRSAKKYVVKHPFATIGVVLTGCLALDFSSLIEDNTGIRGVITMRKFLKIVCFSIVLFHIALLTGCQNTMNGFSTDVDKNTDDMRRTINS